jgi:hypothetical protein
VIVQGRQKTGIVKKRRGRILTIEYAGERDRMKPETIDIDQKYVKKLRDY